MGIPESLQNPESSTYLKGVPIQVLVRPKYTLDYIYLEPWSLWETKSSVHDKPAEKELIHKGMSGQAATMFGCCIVRSLSR